MTTFSIHNFGCRATQADASAIEADLVANGALPVASSAEADVVVVNTCTVTAAADAQARDSIRHIHRANSKTRILVTGCYAQRAPEEIAGLDGVSWVVGNSRQSQIPALLKVAGTTGLDELDCVSTTSGFVPLATLAGVPELHSTHRKIFVDDLSSANFEMPLASSLVHQDRTRPVLKIQDGCSSRCAYCIIPSVRGASRSLPPDAALKVINDLASSGVREVVLSGINLGSYGRDLAPRVSLLSLLSRIINDTPLESIRVSSIEPMDVTQDFVQLLSSTPRFAPHFHMPLQSGSDSILRAMHRWYRAAHYERRIDLIREFLPSAAIGADVIVGFPGESEKNFQETIEFIDRLPFTYLHVFSFSARPGTPAAEMPGQLPPAEIHRRASALRALAAKKESAFRAAQAGRSIRALTLNKHKASREKSTCNANWTPALTGNFLKVRVEGNWPANQWIQIAMPLGDALAQPRAAASI
jgi:threonylcarbamoyladenosine tRNA methylthiotransferase MtaB